MKPLLKRLTAAWSVACGRTMESDRGTDTLADTVELRARSNEAALRLDLEEARSRIDGLKRELDAERSSRSAAIETALTTLMQPFVTGAAAVMSQLALQSGLMAKGKPVSAQDVMALTQALVQVFERHGLEPIGSVGQETRFDTTLHQAARGSMITENTAVVVRMPGYRYRGKIVRKAMVSMDSLEINTPDGITS